MRVGAWLFGWLELGEGWKAGRGGRVFLGFVRICFLSEFWI